MAEESAKEMTRALGHVSDAVQTSDLTQLGRVRRYGFYEQRSRNDQEGQRTRPMGPTPERKNSTEYSKLLRLSIQTMINRSPTHCEAESASAVTKLLTIPTEIGSFLRKSHSGIADEARVVCKELCENFDPLPHDTPLDDDTFESFCDSLLGRYGAKIFRDLSHLIVPPAEPLALRGHKKLKCLVEGVDEVWCNARPLTGPPPKPDYCVGFRRSAFTARQLQKLEP
ncbi:hypothetical protein B0J13DRAFT_606829 [Dactylonectria estremocensis]|uniref:DUF7924 domain-containing protein n=1 Tax=Dactylonectria estremocensis TaxID=1079267 RepID=A0A9P9EWJ2_9HYPO|nr:hypothetical protein B0J13DRAFT_606829 [Dactylonectria estremocensis]